MKIFLNILIIIVIIIFLYWFFILRSGKLDFWKIASKYPDEAYDFFRSKECWKVFEENLPDNYRSLVPKDDWSGPFRLWIPRLEKMIYIFGRYSDFEQAQNEFMIKIKS